ncbi:tRNA lysidine(34) synthetase TilS, partial [Nostocoides japonicum]|uniref:tRNA lysidine(34) synthetase TilS n=1 Tax=Nostocoides japonicum TaxID=99481 RepID=UPI00065B6BCC
MSGPPPAVAAVRHAVRTELADLHPGALVLAACSGGADSLALTAALAVEGPRRALRCGVVTVDHGLQPGSAAVGDDVLATAGRLGLDPRIVVRVTVGSGVDGPEALARGARYQALDEVAAAHRATAVLLGHTRDDQAEQVLLGLARGSGARSLSGMPRRRGVYRRPLLGVTREQTRSACRAEDLTWWDDPHNADPAYARVRARRLLEVIEAELGPGVGAALARTADQLRADADHLDALARREVDLLGAGPWDVAAL